MLESTTRSSAVDYASTSKHVQQKVFFELVSSLNIQEGYNGLDIGCGTGENTAILAEKVGSNGFMLGVDPDEERIKFGRETYKNLSNLKFQIGKSIDISANEEYDFAVSNYVMHWVPEPEKVKTYQNVFNALKPGGEFGIVEGSYDKASVIPDKDILSFCPKETLDKILGAVHFTSLEKNQEMFTSIGFEIVTMEYKEYKHTCTSLDVWFKWVDSTFHGQIKSKEIYEKYKDEVKLPHVDDNGALTDSLFSNKMVVRKPF